MMAFGRADPTPRSDRDYLRALAANGAAGAPVPTAPAAAVPAVPRPALQLADYAKLPILSG
jgi:hypothetical protein